MVPFLGPTSIDSAFGHNKALFWFSFLTQSAFPSPNKSQDLFGNQQGQGMDYRKTAKIYMETTPKAPSLIIIHLLFFSFKQGPQTSW